MRSIVRAAAYVRHATCHCGKRIVANDLRKTVSHEAPECEWFKELVAKAGKSTTTVEILDVETVEPVGTPGGEG